MSRTMLLMALAALLLSGCTANAPADDNDPVIVKSPTDYEYLNDPTAKAHVHDYWGGRDQIEILQAEGSKAPYQGFGFNIRAYQWYPEPDVVIPQGTSEVRVTIEWSSDTEMTHTPPELHYKTAILREWESAGPITSGETIVIPSTNEHNDVPHQRISAWGFSVWYDAADPFGWTVQSNEFAISVVAVRGLEIPEFPGHPDQWGNDTQKVLFDWTSPSPRRNTVIVEGMSEACTNACSFPATPVDGAIVPFDSAYVEATLTTIQDGNIEYMGELDLLYHGADSREWTRLEPDRIEGDTRFYIIPIQSQADGPYAEGTTWEFHVANDEDSPHHGGYYHIGATVHRHDLPY